MAVRRTRSATGADVVERTRLTPERIVEVGLELAREAPTTTLSVRELGTRLGADPTAIYRHFRNKDDLMRALLDELFARSLTHVVAAADDWRDRLRECARGTLDEAMTHPVVGQESIRLSTEGPGELDVMELILDCFARAGLRGDDLVRHYARFGFHVLSGVSGIVSGTDRQDPLWVGAIRLRDDGSHPNVAAVRDHLTGLREDDLFFDGVEAIIESAERAAARA